MSPSSCKHSTLVTDLSKHAADIGFDRASPDELLAAMTMQGRSGSPVPTPRPVSFPAPLVLPGDDLSFDDKEPPQNTRSWYREKCRNKVTAARRTIYVAASPVVDPSCSYVTDWTNPASDLDIPQNLSCEQPETEHVMEYISAFYHGLPVKQLDQTALRYVPWSSGSEQSETLTVPEEFIGLQTPSEIIGIRVRPSRDGVYSHQLNLNGLLDTVISVLPKDAYALVMLVHHDIYEDDDDDFACGRAYGGSRVAVISTARYRPSLDGFQDVEREHAWPASHCKVYIDKCCHSKEKKNPRKGMRKTTTQKFTNNTALRAAVNAHSSLPGLVSGSSANALNGLWCGRVCRTTSHELGHCFGIGHCAYYACSMQSTASLCEDVRQPPYLCPIDDAKVEEATGLSMDERYRALLTFCDDKKNKNVHLFAAFAAWIRAHLEAQRVGTDGITSGTQDDPILVD